MLVVEVDLPCHMDFFFIDDASSILELYNFRIRILKKTFVVIQRYKWDSIEAQKVSLKVSLLAQMQNFKIYSEAWRVTSYFWDV